MTEIKGAKAIKNVTDKLKGFESFMKDNRRDFGKDGHTSLEDYIEALQEWEYADSEQELENTDKFVLAVLKEFKIYEDKNKEIKYV